MTNGNKTPRPEYSKRVFFQLLSYQAAIIFFRGEVARGSSYDRAVKTRMGRLHVINGLTIQRQPFPQHQVGLLNRVEAYRHELCRYGFLAHHAQH